MNTHVVIPAEPRPQAGGRAGTQSGMTTERYTAPDASGSRVFGSPLARLSFARDDIAATARKKATLTASIMDGNAFPRVASHWTNT